MKPLAYLVLICVQVFVNNAVLNEKDLRLQKWTSFKIQHGKEYKAKEEDERRMKIFFDNVEKITEHNQLYEKGEVTYEKGINKFADLTSEEFAELYLSDFGNNKNVNEDFSIANFSLEEYQQLPPYKNWVTEEHVTPVKDQGQICDNSWAFATVGAIESHISIYTKRQRILSEQNLIDCVGGMNTCNEGSRPAAYNYVIRNRGIALEELYPYRGQSGLCRYNRNQRGAGTKGYNTVTQGEEHIKCIVGTIGPVSVGISRGDLIQNYRSGIYDQPNCYHKEKTGHSLLIVGYGTDSVVVIPNGTVTEMDYWLAKNSWGSNWGAKGYIKIARNKNVCGIAKTAEYPIGVN